MKYFVILLVLFTVSFLTVNHAYGIWLPQSPEELLEESQLIFVGTISSVNKLEFERSSSYITTENGSEKEVIENYPLILDEYTVTVEEFVKNPQDTDTLTVQQPTVSTPGRLLPHGGFEIGDRVLFYIESFDGTNTYSKESFLIPEQCETSSVIHEPKIIGSDFTMMQNGMEKKDNFTANIPIWFIAKSDTGTLSGDSPSIEYDAFISKQVGKIYKERVFHQTVTADAKPCEWLSVAKWEFTPDAGNYLLNGDVYKEKSRYSISNTFFSVLPETPLKQIQSGVSFNEIQCKQNLVLIQKYDGSPACVTESTKTKLIERGWTSSSVTVTIYSDFEQNRDRAYTNPRNVVIDLEKNNSVTWVNNADYTVQIYDYEDKSWSTGQIDPSMSDAIQFNNTGYYEFAIESTNDRHFGKIVVISDNTNSLPIETRMKMGMAIVSNDLGKNSVLMGVGTGDVNDGIIIDINQKELEKREDAESYYYNMYKEMIPFDVPITIDFSEPFRLLE